MNSKVLSQAVSFWHIRSEVFVGRVSSYSASALHSETGEQLLSEVGVANTDRKSLNGSHTVSVVHWRLDVVVGAFDSYCQRELHSIILPHSVAVAAS